MVEALGLTSVEPAGSGARLYAPALRGGWELRPFLRDSFLGIPAHPDASDCAHVLGEAGVRRALEDRSMGGGVGMDEAGETLAGFVAARMGEAVLERSVRPIIAGIYTADPLRAGDRHGRPRAARRDCPSRIPGRCGRGASGRRRIAPHPRSLRRGRHVCPR